MSAWISAFKVYLPRVREVAILEEAVPHEGLPAGAETPLLVDDEPMVQDLAARVLRGQGYRVLEASKPRRRCWKAARFSAIARSRTGRKGAPTCLSS